MSVLLILEPVTLTLPSCCTSSSAVDELLAATTGVSATTSSEAGAAVSVAVSATSAEDIMSSPGLSAYKMPNERKAVKNKIFLFNIINPLY